MGILEKPVNFLEETKFMLAALGKSEEDVEWVGTRRYEGDRIGVLAWDEFVKLADFEYVRLLPVTVDPWLYVVGVDWWLERTIEFNSEWWSGHVMPEKPTTTEKIRTLEVGKRNRGL